MRRDSERALSLAAGGIERDELVAGGKPDVRAVIAHAVHVVDAREGSILASDFGG